MTISSNQKRTLADLALAAGAVLVVPRVVLGEWLPLVPAVVGLLVAAWVARRPQPGAAAPSWAKHLLHQAAAAAVIGAAWVWFFSLPRSVLWFAPVWCLAEPLAHWARQVGHALFPRGRVLHPGSLAARLQRPCAILRSLAETYGPPLVLGAGLPAAVLLLLRRFGPVEGVMTDSAAMAVLASLPVVAALSTALLRRVGATAAGALIPLAAAFLLAGALQVPSGGLTRLMFAWLVWSTVGVLLLRRILRFGVGADQRLPLDESLRIGVVAAASAWVMSGFMGPGFHGTGDARWYATMLADAVAQARAHVFPLWVGQSPSQFNGAIYPLRVAPAYLHFGALLDALTLHTLAIVALQSLLLFLLGLAGALSAYLCLRSLLPRRRWAAALLAVLFAACPGVAAVAYFSDLYMSWTTVAFVPVACFAAVRNAAAPRLWSSLLLGATLGLCWWGHSPIALWTTSFAGLVQLVGLVRRRPARAGWISLAAGAALFLAVAAYPVGSVLGYPPEPGVSSAGFQKASPGNIELFIRQAFPGVLQPLAADYRLADFQLGYALWAVLLVGLIVGWRRLQGGERALLVMAALVLASMVPFAVNGPWSFVPAIYRDTTGNWVMNRFYLIAAAMVVMGAAGFFRGLGRGAYRWAVAGLVLAGAWSLQQASFFPQRAGRDLDRDNRTPKFLRPENITVTQFAYLIFQRPPNFSHGVVDPQRQFRLLDRQSGAVLEDGTRPKPAGRPSESYSFDPASDPLVPAYYLSKPLTLAPGRRYVLSFAFNPAVPVSGVLQLAGSGLDREYLLPEYGGAESFGRGGAHDSSIVLWTSQSEPEPVKVSFVPQAPTTMAAAAHFAEVTLTEDEVGSLGVHITGWIPLEAQVSVAQPAWFETPRMYQTAYQARVDGQLAEVRRSPWGLAMVAVPAGRSQVELRFVPPLGLAALFWLSFATVLLAAGAGLRAWWTATPEDELGAARF